MHPSRYALSQSPQTTLQPKSPRRSPLQRPTTAVFRHHETFNLNAFGGSFVFSLVGEKKESEGTASLPSSPRTPCFPLGTVRGQERCNEGNRYLPSHPALAPLFLPDDLNFAPRSFSPPPPLFHTSPINSLVCQSWRQREAAPVKAFFRARSREERVRWCMLLGERAVGTWGSGSCIKGAKRAAHPLPSFASAKPTWLRPHLSQLESAAKLKNVATFVNTR